MAGGAFIERLASRSHAVLPAGLAVRSKASRLVHIGQDVHPHHGVWRLVHDAPTPSHQRRNTNGPTNRYQHSPRLVERPVPGNRKGWKEASIRHRTRNENTAIEVLLAEFHEALRLHGRPDYSILGRCPEGSRKELLSLMNVAALAHRALASERAAARRRAGDESKAKATS